MFDFNYILESNRNLIEFLQEKKDWKFFTVWVSSSDEEVIFLKFILKLRVNSEEFSNWDNLLVASFESPRRRSYLVFALTSRRINCNKKK